MGDNSSNFEIRITTQAELSGAVALEQQLERQIGRAKALGQEFGQLQAQLTRVKGVIATYSEAHDDAAKHVDKHVLSHKQLHQIIHALNNTVPGLGMLLQSAFSPIGAAVTIGVAALEHFKEKIKEVNDELDRQGEEAAKPLTHHLETLRESVVENALEAERFRVKLEEVTRGGQTFEQQIQRTIEELKRQGAEMQSLNDATKGHELAMLGLLHAAGLSSTSEYEAQKFAIEEEYAEKKRKLQETMLTREIEARKAGVQKAQDAIHIEGGLTDQDRLATEESKAAGIKSKDATKDRETVEKNKEEADQAKVTFEKKTGEKKVELFKRIDSKEIDPTVAAVENAYVVPDFQKEYDEWKRLKTNKENLDKQYKQAPDKEAAAKVAADRAKVAAEAAQRRLIEAQDAITAGNRDIEIKTAERNTLAGSNKEIGKLEHDSHAAELGAKWIARRNELLNKGATGGKLTADEAKEVRDINQRLGPKPIGHTPAQQTQAAEKEAGNARQGASEAIDENIEANTPRPTASRKPAPPIDPATRAQQQIDKNAQTIAGFLGKQYEASPEQKPMFEHAIEQLEQENKRLSQRIHPNETSARAPDGDNGHAVQSVVAKASETQNTTKQLIGAVEMLLNHTAATNADVQSLVIRIKNVESQVRHNRNIN